MFLIDSAQAGSDWDGTLAAVKRVLERADAEVVYLEKWADRRLAFEIAHKTRGTYILCYFRADGSKIAGIEKDVTLSEQIMRVLILTAEDRPGDSVKRDLAGETKAPQETYPRDERRDERRSGPRTRDDAPKDKQEDQADASPEPADAEAAQDASKDASKEAGESDDTASAVETSADTGADADAVAPDTAAPAEAAAAGDDAGPDTESEKA